MNSIKANYQGKDKWQKQNAHIEKQMGNQNRQNMVFRLAILLYAIIRTKTGQAKFGALLYGGNIRQYLGTPFTPLLQALPRYHTTHLIY